MAHIIYTVFGLVSTFQSCSTSLTKNKRDYLWIDPKPIFNFQHKQQCYNLIHKLSNRAPLFILPLDFRIYTSDSNTAVTDFATADYLQLGFKTGMAVFTGWLSIYFLQKQVRIKLVSVYSVNFLRCILSSQFYRVKTDRDIHNLLLTIESQNHTNKNWPNESTAKLNFCL